jgi:hypothetical protein
MKEELDLRTAKENPVNIRFGFPVLPCLKPSELLHAKRNASSAETGVTESAG